MRAADPHTNATPSVANAESDWLRLSGFHDAQSHESFRLDPEPETRSDSLPDMPGFEILDCVGRGGMGVVYKARHLGLGRVVALKMLLPGSADPQQMSRLQVEAEALAQLHDPHVVQVFEIGQHQKRPYLVLEYVAGQGLDQRLKEIRPTPDQAAQLVATLAVSLENAHARGIIHRDLKPANVLVTRDGFPKLVDFGLAKRLQSDSALTQDGTLLGTPAYMAPEQFSELPLGPAVDIYALGVLLYEMLAGKPPFVATCPNDWFVQVTLREPISPSYWHPGVPRDLETICLKCLQKAPADRYASARALADDLQRFLERRPILARPLGPFGRTLRWSRRNALTATLLGSLILTLAVAVVALVMGYRGVRSEQQQTAAINRQLTDQTRRTEDALAKESRRRQQARAALDALTSVMIDDLLVASDLKDEQRRFLQATEKQYADFADDPGEDVESQEMAGKALFRLGSIRRRLGDLAGAARAFEKSCGVFERLLSADSRNVDFAREWAKSSTQVGRVQFSWGRYREAEASFRQAMARLEPLLTDPISDRQLLSEWINVRAFIHLVLHATASDKRDEEYARTLAVFDRVPPEWKKEPETRYRIAQAQGDVGRLAMEKGDYWSAEKYLGEALEAMVDVAKQPGAWRGQVQYLGALRSLQGRLLRRMGRLDEAEKEFREGLRVREGLVINNPAVVEYRQDLAGDLDQLATVLEMPKRADEAKGLLDRALGLREKLLQDDPKSVRNQVGSLQIFTAFGNHYTAKGDLETALGWYDRAFEHGQRIHREVPELTYYHKAFANSLRRRGQVLEKLKRDAEIAENRQILETLTP